MTLSEFKAWFEGFTETMDGPPSAKQWERIQTRVKEITGQSIPYPVHVDRYPYVKPWYNNDYRAYGLSQNNLASASLNTVPVTAAQGGGIGDWQNLKVGGTGLGPDGHMAKFSQGEGVSYDSYAAMTALGKADADALKAA